MKKTYRVTLLLFLLAVVILLVGCSSDTTEQADKTNVADEQQAEDNQSQATANKELLTFEDSLEQVLNEPWERILHEDYSGFYENEFSYLTDAVTLDDYLTYRQVTYRYPMDVINIEILTVDKLEGDSAFVDVNVTLVDSLGNESEHAQALTVYYTDGRWIKPKVSIVKNQLEYEDKIRQAIEDADDE